MTESEALAVREIVRRVTGSEDLAHDVIETMLRRDVRNPLAYGPLKVARWLQATQRKRAGFRQQAQARYEAEIKHEAGFLSTPRIEAQLDARGALQRLNQQDTLIALTASCRQVRYQARRRLLRNGLLLVWVFYSAITGDLGGVYPTEASCESARAGAWEGADAGSKDMNVTEDARVRQIWGTTRECQMTKQGGRDHETQS